MSVTYFSLYYQSRTAKNLHEVCWRNQVFQCICRFMYIRASVMTANPLQPVPSCYWLFIPIFNLVVRFGSAFFLGGPISRVPELFEMIGVFPVTLLPVCAVWAVILCGWWGTWLITAGRRFGVFLFKEILIIEVHVLYSYVGCECIFMLVIGNFF